MSVSLRGSLRDFGIAEVFQLIGQQRKTGALQLSRRREQVEILFDAGAVVSAHPVRQHPDEALADMLVRCGALTRERAARLLQECEESAENLVGRAGGPGGASAQDLEAIRELLTRETIFDVLSWTKGSFDFQARAVDHDREPSDLLGAEQILMDGMRRLDESEEFADSVPGDDVIFRRVEGPPPPALRDPESQRILSLVDGRLALRRIVDLSRLGRFEATRSLVRLRDAGVIEPVSIARRSRRTVRASLRAAGAETGWRLIAAVLCFAALYACATWVRAASPRTPAPGFALSQTPLDRVRDAYETRRLRHALETFQLLEGRWPAALPELVGRGLLPKQALAPDRGHSYYYALRDGGALLLAPER